MDLNFWVAMLKCETLFIAKATDDGNIRYDANEKSIATEKIATSSEKKPAFRITMPFKGKISQRDSGSQGGEYPLSVNRNRGIGFWIGTTPYYMGVMLQRDSQNQRLYLHDVVIKEETSNDSEADLSTTGAAEIDEHLFLTRILHNALNVKRKESTPRSGSGSLVPAHSNGQFFINKISQDDGRSQEGR